MAQQPAPEKVDGRIINAEMDVKEASTKEVRKSPVFFNVPCLTGLRGFAALGVVAGHLTGGTGAHTYLNGWEELQELGNVMVLLFFVLSAFLLTVRALTERQKPSDAKFVKWSENGITIPWLSVRWIKYLIRRSFRILPLYWVVLVIIAAISWLHEPYQDLRNYTPFGWSKVLPYMFFHDVNSIFWTIPPEFEYYLIMPLYIVLYEMAERKDKMGEWTMGTQTNPPAYPYGLGTAEAQMVEHYRKGLHNKIVHGYYRFGRRIILLVVLTVFNGWIVPLFWSAHSAVDYYHIFPFIFRFWVGSLAAFIYHMLAQYGYVIYVTEVKKPNINQKFGKVASKWIGIFCDLVLWLIVVYMFLSFPYWSRHILHRYVPTTPLTYYADHMGDWPVIGAAVVCLLVSGACRDRSFARFFEWSFFKYAGEISFPLYMTHPAAIHLTTTKDIEGIDGLLYTYGAAVLIATILHYVVEKPVGNIAGRLAKWVQTTYFSKDPKLALDVEQHDELAAKRYTQMGLESGGSLDPLVPGPVDTHGAVVTVVQARHRASDGKAGPMFQVVHDRTSASSPMSQVTCYDAPPPGNGEDEAPLAVLANTRAYSPAPRQLEEQIAVDAGNREPILLHRAMTPPLQVGYGRPSPAATRSPLRYSQQPEYFHAGNNYQGYYQGQPTGMQFDPSRQY
ncbi:hypothetical protein HKX48_004670 [Thoreauomyces humboldtii]|nr:hypothetical protein HKX48_004670 [Thoreauomyces humboldtii]